MGFDRLKKKVCSRVSSFFGGRFSLPLPRGERGFIGGAITGIIIIAIVAFFVFVFTGGVELIVRSIAKGVHLVKLLVHVPQIRVEGMTFPSAVYGGSVPSFLSAAGSAGGSLYSIFRMISMAMLLIGFIIIGLSYVLEQFNVMSPGNAENLLSESVLIIVLIFIFPYFFNAGAVALNAVDEQTLLTPKVPQDASVNYVGDQHRQPGDTLSPKQVGQDIATAAGTVPGLIPGFGGSGPLPSNADPSKMLVALVTMAASFMSVLIAFSTGVFKIIATVGLAAAFPLVLAMRMVPFLRNVSQRLTNSLIGLMLASLVIAVFFRVGWEILVVIWGEEVFCWAVGVALMMAAAGAFTITAPAMSGMSAEISGTLGRSTGGAIAGLSAAGVTAAAGGAAGAATGGAGALKGGEGAAGGAKGALKGAGRGTLKGAPGQDLVGSMKSGGAGGTEAAKEQLAGGPGGGGQHPETSGVMSERLTAEFNRQKSKPADALPQDDVQAGKRYKSAIESGNLNPEEAHRAYGKAREEVRGEEGKWTDTRIDAVREKGELTADEISQGTKDAVADIKSSKDWEGTPSQQAQLHAALGKVMQGKKTGE